jgi:hypothetical protein
MHSMKRISKKDRHSHITRMWSQLRDIIDTTYQANIEEDARSLRDYAQNQSWSDHLEKLLAEETVNERQHRSPRSIRGFSSQDAAKLIICANVLRGSELTEMPSALTFISFRHSAAEANLLGYLIRANVMPEWKQAVSSLDYAECMEAGNV